jgi:hypothetical protein
MNDVPEEGRDGRTGASHRPSPPGNLLAGEPGSVPIPSSAVRLGFADSEARRSNSRGRGSKSGDGGRSGAVAGRSRGGRVERVGAVPCTTCGQHDRRAEAVTDRRERAERASEERRQSARRDSGSSGRVRCASRSCDRPAVVVADRPDGNRALVCWPHLALVESLGGSLVGVVRGE